MKTTKAMKVGGKAMTKGALVKMLAEKHEMKTKVCGVAAVTCRSAPTTLRGTAPRLFAGFSHHCCWEERLQTSVRKDMEIASIMQACGDRSNRSSADTLAKEDFSAHQSSDDESSTERHFDERIEIDEDIFYVSQPALAAMTAKYNRHVLHAQADEIIRDDIEKLVNSDLWEPDTLVVPIGMRGMPFMVFDSDDLIEEVGAEQAAMAYISAYNCFRNFLVNNTPNINGRPAVPMLAAEGKKFDDFDAEVCITGTDMEEATRSFTIDLACGDIEDESMDWNTLDFVASRSGKGDSTTDASTGMRWPAGQRECVYIDNDIVSTARPPGLPIARPADMKMETDNACTARPPGRPGLAPVGVERLSPSIETCCSQPLVGGSLDQA